MATRKIIKAIVAPAKILAGSLSLFKPDNAANPLIRIAKQAKISATMECKARTDKIAPTKKTGAKNPSMVRDVSIPSQPNDQKLSHAASDFRQPKTRSEN